MNGLAAADKHYFAVLRILIVRNVIRKVRDRNNMLVTFLLPIILGVAIGWILRYSSLDEYVFFDNFHIATFYFFCVLVALFSGLTTSIDEIIKDRPMFLREKLAGLSVTMFYYSKFILLLFICFLQNLLFIGVGYLILGGKEFYMELALLCTVTSMSGIVMGLFISAVPKMTSKAAISLVPLLLIPQIIFGGSLIQFGEMNRELYLFDKSPVPLFCQFIPSRWSYESIISLVGVYNKFAVNVSGYNEELEKLDDKVRSINRERNSIAKKEVMDSKSEERYKELKKERKELVVTRDSISDALERIEALYKKHYANRTIDNMVEKPIEIEDEMFYRMFSIQKRIPFSKIILPTFIYNTMLIILVNIFISIVSISLLKKN